MAQSEILGLFGGQSPLQLRNNYRDSFMVSPNQMGNQNLLQQVVSMGGNAGAGVGSALGGMLGGKVAGEAEASQIEDTLRQVNQMNLPSTYAKMQAMSGLFAEKGLSKQSMIAGAEAERLKPKAAETTKVAKLMSEQKNFAPGTPEFEAYGAAIEKETQGAAPASSTLAKLMSEQKDFAPGTPEFEAYQAAIGKETERAQPAQPRIVQLQNAYKNLDPNSKEAKEIQRTIDAIGRGNVLDNNTPVFVDVKDINSIRSGVRPELSPFSDVINSAQQGLAFLKLGNPKAEGQVNRSLASLSGDTQTSALEINLTSNAGPLGQQIADTISRVLVGGSGAQSKLEKQHVLEASLIHNTLKYNTKRDNIINSYQNTNMSDKQITSIVGPPQELPKDLIARFLAASGQTYEPTKFDYRMSNNGSIQKREKGKK
jgi:hypothetical protein